MLHQFQALRSDVKQHETGKTGSASDDKPFHNIGEVALQKTHKGFFGGTVRPIFVSLFCLSTGLPSVLEKVLQGNPNESLRHRQAWISIDALP
jgi:hypothetical protein